VIDRSSPPEYSLLSIVLPVMNQADHIARVLEMHAAALERLGINYELIPVVNGSSDASMEQCQEAATSNPRIRPFVEADGGFGLAIRRGLREAKGDLLCFANSARTSTADLMTMVEFAIRNPGYVFKANRWTYDNWRRRLGSIGFNILCRSLYRVKCWDMNGTPKIFPRRFERLMELTQNDSMVDVEFNAICHRYNYDLIEIVLKVTPRHGGRSSTNLKTALSLYTAAIRFAPVFWRTHGYGTIGLPSASESNS